MAIVAGLEVVSSEMTVACDESFASLFLTDMNNCVGINENDFGMDGVR